MANVMNEFFATVAIDLDNKLPPVNHNIAPNIPHNNEQVINNINQSLFLTPVSINECITIISKLKNTKK